MITLFVMRILYQYLVLIRLIETLRPFDVVRHYSIKLKVYTCMYIYNIIILLKSILKYFKRHEELLICNYSYLHVKYF